MQVLPTLFGDWTVLRELGRRGSPGTMGLERYQRRNEAAEQITFNSRRIMVVPSGRVPGMAVWRERLFAAMHLNANLPAAYFGVPTSHNQVVEVGLEVEI